MDKYKMIEEDALWVIKHYGSDAKERKDPGSKIKSQAARIAEFVRQLDEAESLLDVYKLDLVKVIRR